MIKIHPGLYQLAACMAVSCAALNVEGFKSPKLARRVPLTHFRWYLRAVCIENLSSGVVVMKSAKDGV